VAGCSKAENQDLAMPREQDGRWVVVDFHSGEWYLAEASHDLVLGQASLRQQERFFQQLS